MIDVIKTQFPQLKKVIQFVCGNGLVCETVEEARHIAFGGPERRKVRDLITLSTKLKFVHSFVWSLPSPFYSCVLFSKENQHTKA
jgi:hypothetical protein